MKILKRLFCRHHFTWVRNIYGDEIIYCGYKRSLWECAKCGKEQFREALLLAHQGEI